MKIICNKKEFVELVRSCEGTLLSDACNYCAFSGLCSQGCSLDTRGMDFIEDICEFPLEE